MTSPLQRSLAAMAFAASAGASATPVLIDFNDQPYGGYTTNLTISGVTFSPSCHYDLGGYSNNSHVSNWIGFDTSGCSDDSSIGYNKNYLGPDVGTRGKLAVMLADGGLFDLRSFYAVSGDRFSLQSSNGGIIHFGSANVMDSQYEFTGPQWTNLEWLVFYNNGGMPAGFDNLELDVRTVDEPVTGLLLALPLVALLYSRRKAKNYPSTTR